MVITGALVWWNELPEDLDRCIRGLANVADRVIAVDGAYRRYPTGTARSAKNQVAAIRDAAKDTGLGCIIIQPDQMWAGQVEKRNFILAAASVGSDLIAVIDADHVITTDREKTRQHLARANGIDVWSVPFLTPIDQTRTPEERSPGKWHEWMMKETRPVPHFFRVMPDLRVERKHWWYSGIKDGRRHWLYGGDNSYPAAPITPFPLPYHIEHRCAFRTAEQIRVSRGFLNDRAKVVDLTGQEDDVPGLFPPDFDYVTMPE